jgi:hypothetical protein
MRATPVRSIPGLCCLSPVWAACQSTEFDLCSILSDLHQLNPASVREIVEAAGFVLNATSTTLASHNDQHEDEKTTASPIGS